VDGLVVGGVTGRSTAQTVAHLSAQGREGERGLVAAAEVLIAQPLRKLGLRPEFPFARLVCTEELDYVPMPASVVNMVQTLWAKEIKDPSGKLLFMVSH
jgi:hypothetical protein